MAQRTTVPFGSKSESTEEKKDADPYGPRPESIKGLDNVPEQSQSQVDLFIIMGLGLCLPLVSASEMRSVIVRQSLILTYLIIAFSTRMLFKELSMRLITMATWFITLATFFISHIIISYGHSDARKPIQLFLLSENILLFGITALLWLRFTLDTQVMLFNLYLNAGGSVLVLVSLAIFRPSQLSRMVLFSALSSVLLLYLLLQTIKRDRSKKRVIQEKKKEEEGLLKPEPEPKRVGSRRGSAIVASTQGDSLVKKLTQMRKQAIIDEVNASKSKGPGDTANEPHSRSVVAGSPRRTGKKGTGANKNSQEDKINSEKITKEDIDSLLQCLTARENRELFQPNFSIAEAPEESKKNFFDGEEMPEEVQDFLKVNYTQKDEDFSDILSNSGASSMMLVNRSISFVNLDHLKEICEDWNYDVFKLKSVSKTKTFGDFGKAIFEKFNLEDVLKIRSEPALAANFIETLGSNYFENNPFHNPLHPVETTHVIGFFLVNGLATIVPPLEMCSLIIASLGHDVAHPGLREPYLVARKSRLPFLYNDQAVLENFHATCLFQILEMPSCNILKGLDEKEWRYVRKLVISIILDTYGVKNFALTNKFKALAEQADVNVKDENNRLLLLSMVMKAGDIGHGAKSHKIHLKWSRRVIEEFWKEGDDAKKNGIPLIPTIDRNTRNVAEMQKGFMIGVVLPIYESLADFFRDKAIFRDQCLMNAKKNLEYWEQEVLNEKDGRGNFIIETKKVIDEIREEGSSEQKSMFSAL